MITHKICYSAEQNNRELFQQFFLSEVMMKNTLQCPKCSSGDVIRIPGLSGAYGSGNNIPMGMTIFSSVKVTRYLCCGCGYSEEWIDDREDIEKLKKKY